MVRGVQRPGLLVGFGVASWLVPFAVSVPFYGPDGQLSVELLAFKSVMILVGALVGAALLAAYVTRLDGHYLLGASVAGLTWFAINVLLDLLVLVGGLGMPLGEWTVGIGVRYLVIPIYAVAVGYVAERT